METLLRLLTVDGIYDTELRTAFDSRRVHGNLEGNEDWCTISRRRRRKYLCVERKQAATHRRTFKVHKSLGLSKLLALSCADHSAFFKVGFVRNKYTCTRQFYDVDFRFSKEPNMTDIRWLLVFVTSAKEVTSSSAFLHCALAAAQCIVIGPVCLFVCVGVCVCGSVTTITRNYVHRSSPNWVCRYR